jgi:hypothetical protein
MFLVLSLVVAALVLSGMLFVGAWMEAGLLEEGQPTRGR